MPKTYLIDVTNRDGEQTARVCLSKLQKTIINWLLDQTGVYQSEMGFPLSKHETRYINANVALTKSTPDQPALLKRMQLSGWSRALASDVKKAQQRTELAAFQPVDFDLRADAAVEISRQVQPGEIIQSTVDAVKAAIEGGAVTASINAEDAFPH